MAYNGDKVDDMVLAILYLGMWQDRTGTHAWERHDWGALNRLYEKGYLGDPKGRAKSVIITDEGRIKAEQLFQQLFGQGS